ncbi:MAG: hypothetical protein R3A52_28490 [Polyangiales bacterium]
MTLRRAALSTALTAALAACGTSPPTDPPPVSCDGVSSQAMPASAEGRWLLGLASRYPADTALSARGDALRRSQRARREVAWMAIARALAPVPTAQPTPAADATVPRFRTWYDREDVVRTFQRLYGALSPEQRAASARFDDAAIDEAFGWNARFVTTLTDWDADRLARFAAGLDSPARLTSAGGVQRIALSPDAVRHLVSSYPEILRCLNTASPPVFVDGAPAPQRVAREPLALTPCGSTVYGPYFVATGGSLTARVEGGAEGAALTVIEGVSVDGAQRCAAGASEGCAVSGPGTFLVRVAARGRASGGALDVTYTPPDAAVTACLHGVFPPQAATVAMEWRRADLGMALPVYDTSGAGLSRRLAQAEATWGDGDASADPQEGAIYTLRLASGSAFRLAGMHIRTRELDHWLNITMWWSPRPDEDFGADRPDFIRALGAPWNAYKMCVATDYDEQDGDPDGGYARDVPSLAAALRAVHEGRGGPSWCSNPYIDAGPGLVRSNCVGCHQHALSGVRPSEVQNDAARFPLNARALVRNNLPADGFWGIDGGDQLGSVFAETVDYFRTAR